MKLKKIVSLALAGVMAVSMLAGCANNGGNGGNDSGKEPVTQPATGVAAAFNDGQAATNKAEVKFVSDSKLDTALAQAIQMNGQKASALSVWTDVMYSTGIIPDTSVDYNSYSGEATATQTTNFMTKADEDDCKDGMTLSYGGVVKLNSKTNNVYTDKAAVKQMAAYINDMVADLDTTTYVKGTTAAGHTFYNFSYDGKASMVSVQNATGDYDYYFVIIVTQTLK